MQFQFGVEFGASSREEIRIRINACARQNKQITLFVRLKIKTTWHYFTKVLQRGFERQNATHLGINL
jgi:hypothetical protein